MGYKRCEKCELPPHRCDCAKGSKSELSGLLDALSKKDARIADLEEALKRYINAGCMEGTNYVNQKAALDNALMLLGI